MIEANKIVAFYNDPSKTGFQLSHGNDEPCYVKSCPLEFYYVEDSQFKNDEEIKKEGKKIAEVEAVRICGASAFFSTDQLSSFCLRYRPDDLLLQYVVSVVLSSKGPYCGLSLGFSGVTLFVFENIKIIDAELIDIDTIMRYIPEVLSWNELGLPDYFVVVNKAQDAYDIKVLKELGYREIGNSKVYIVEEDVLKEKNPGSKKVMLEALERAEAFLISNKPFFLSLYSTALCNEDTEFADILADRFKREYDYNINDEFGTPAE